MLRMLKYIWSSLALLCVSVGAYGADSTVVSNRWYKGFFLDVDVVEPAVSLFEDQHKGANASLSVNLKNVFFPTLLVGYASYDASSDYSSYVLQPDNYTYKVKGPYFKVGLDFNMIKSTQEFKPTCYIGARYAFSCYNYDIQNVAVSQSEWGSNATINKSSSTFAQWGEFLGGVRVPVYKRFYLGFEGCYKWSFSPKTDSYINSDGTMVTINQTYAPGFGDKNGTTWGFRYMASFFF